MLSWHWKSTCLAARDHVLETQMQALRGRMRRVEHESAALRGQWETREAARALKVAIDAADVHAGRRPWVQLVEDEQPRN